MSCNHVKSSLKLIHTVHNYVHSSHMHLKNMPMKVHTKLIEMVRLLRLMNDIHEMTLKMVGKESVQFIF